MEHWEQTSEKKFTRTLIQHKATMCKESSGGRYDWYYAHPREDNKVVARIDHGHTTFEILVGVNKDG